MQGGKVRSKFEDVSLVTFECVLSVLFADFQEFSSSMLRLIDGGKNNGFFYWNVGVSERCLLKE